MPVIQLVVGDALFADCGGTPEAFGESLRGGLAVMKLAKHLRDSGGPQHLGVVADPKKLDVEITHLPE